MRFILTTILSIIIGMSYSSNKDLSQKGKIKGAIVEKANKQPLEYATVSLYNAKTGALVSGTITDYLGHFKIDHPNEGEYYLGLFYSHSDRNAKYGCRAGRSDGQCVIGRVFSYTFAVF